MSFSDLRRAVLIYNPMSGRQLAQRLMPRLLQEFETSGFEVEPQPTTCAGDATRLAVTAAARPDIEVVFAMGGDGTLREAAHGLVDTEVALGPIPAGTANVLAIALGIPRQPLAAVRAMAGAKAIEFDVGMAGDDPFLMMASSGIDAAVMASQNPLLKRRIGRAAFGVAGLAQWGWRYGFPDLELHIDGKTRHTSFFALCNIPFYGGGFRLAPEADSSDGWLDLVLFTGRRLATVGFARDLVLGRIDRRRDVEHLRVRELEVLAELDHGLQVDGDVFPSKLPLHFGVRPKSLRVLVPIDGR